MATGKLTSGVVLEPVPADTRYMGKLEVGSKADLKPGDREKLEKPPMEPVKKAKGGTASARADGCAQRGKTRGTIVMCKGGMAR